MLYRDNFKPDSSFSNSSSYYNRTCLTYEYLAKFIEYKQEEFVNKYIYVNNIVVAI